MQGLDKYFFQVIFVDNKTGKTKFADAPETYEQLPELHDFAACFNQHFRGTVHEDAYYRDCTCLVRPLHAGKATEQTRKLMKRLTGTFDQQSQAAAMTSDVVTRLLDRGYTPQI